MKRTPVLFVAALTFVLSACSTQSSPRDYADRFMAAENKAWSTGNLGDLKALEADNIQFHLAGTELKGWKAHEEFITNGRQVATELKQNWKYLSGDNNYILLDYSSSAILRVDDKTPPQATSNSYLFVLRVKDEKIVEIWANGSAISKPLSQ
jgi:ketosteroid isomerase-like protein